MFELYARFLLRVIEDLTWTFRHCLYRKYTICAFGRMSSELILMSPHKEMEADILTDGIRQHCHILFAHGLA